jgi:DNA-binding NtrC family response regulator
MPTDPLASVVSLIKQNYHPFPTLPELLCRLLQVAISATGSTHGELCMKGLGPDSEQTATVLFLDASTGEVFRQSLALAECSLFNRFEGNGSGVLATNKLTNELDCAKWTPVAKSSMAVPIRYQGDALGAMTLGSVAADHYTPARLRVCQWIATEIAYQSKRYEINRAVTARTGKDLMLIGVSDAARRTDEFIERASAVNLPALITGEFGSEQRHIAYALHYGGPRQDHPLVEVSCAALDPHTAKQTLSEQLQQAAGGTIYFNGIDEAEYPLQCKLLENLESHVGEWTRRAGRSDSADVRLIASACRTPDDLAEERVMLRLLVEKFDYLVTHLAPLRTRKEDLEPLAEYFLTKHTTVPDRRFSGEVLEAFRAYDWPKNVYELERVVARLAVMSEEEVIRMRDLYVHAPTLVEKLQQLRPGLCAAQQQVFSAATTKKNGGRGSTDNRVVHLAQALIKREFADTKRFHPGLQKALEYVAENLHDAISLHELARHACLSASHLSYLFQRTLGVSFKSFLAILRIEEAKQLLVEKPYMRITEISFEVGFGDLSHFERMFKRLVGQPPRDYRQVALGAAEPEDLPAP